NAGERCLAGSVAVAVGRAADTLLDPLRDAATKLIVGPGDDPSVQVGPLIRAEHRDKVAGYVDKGIAEGAELIVDGPHELSRTGSTSTLARRLSSRDGEEAHRWG